jgi:hypothetical protein
MKSEIETALRTWLVKAADIFTRLDRLKKPASEERISPDVSENELRATELIQQLGYPERWDEIYEQVIEMGSFERIKGGWTGFSPMDDDHLLELAVAANEIRLQCLVVDDDRGFDWKQLNHPLWEQTLQNMRRAGFRVIATEKVAKESANTTPQSEFSQQLDRLEATVATMKLPTRKRVPSEEKAKKKEVEKDLCIAWEKFRDKKGGTKEDFLKEESKWGDQIHKYFRDEMRRKKIDVLKMVMRIIDRNRY